MYRLIRITSNDYRDFRKAYSKINYSFFLKGEEQPLLSQQINKMIQFAIKGKGEFLDEVENPNNELYFFEIDGEIQGIIELIFSTNNICDIYQFAVFEQGKGWGSLFYQEVLKIIKEHHCRKITLWCPYDGAQVFWRKQGFNPKSKCFLFFIVILYDTH